MSGDTLASIAAQRAEAEARYLEALEQAQRLTREGLRLTAEAARRFEVEQAGARRRPRVKVRRYRRRRG